MADLPSGIVTFLYTDIESSTPLWEREPEQMRLALDRHHAILRSAIAAHAGQAYKTIGDAFQAAFVFPMQAVAAALAAQRALAAQDWETSVPLRVRMGVHVGPAVAEGSDYTTTHTLNRVARIMAAGHGGQILLSGEVADFVRRDLPADVIVRDMGKQRMKGLTHLEHLFQLVAPGLPADFPSLKTLDYTPQNLPIQPTPFIGRAHELALVEAILTRSNTRLVTITGPGGMGKTRLALAVAERQLHSGRFADGTFFVALAPVGAAEHIITTLADALAFPLATGGAQNHTPRQQVLDYLRAKQLLLVLDNCEHLLDGVRDLAIDLVAAAPELRLLATSREPLHLHGEQLFPLGGLSAEAEADAVALFTSAVARLQPDFTVDARILGDVARICRLVGGMPLAIELAAGWADTLTMDMIAAEIAQDLGVLETETANMPARHRSMRAIFDTTWQRLDAVDGSVFARLAVFRGGCTRGAVQAITGATLRQLHRFVGRSLLQYDPTRDRYSIHELLRQYAAEQLAADPDQVQAARDRHAAYYLTALAARERDLTGARQIEALSEIERDSENVRAAWEWAVMHRQESLLAPAAGCLSMFYEWQGRIEEGEVAFRLAADSAHATAESIAPGLRAVLLACQSRFIYLLGDRAAAAALLQQAQATLDSAAASVDGLGAAQAVVFLQIGRCNAEHDYAIARPAFEQSQALYQSLGKQSGAAAALLGLGISTIPFASDYDLAQRCLEQSLALYRTLEDRLGISEVLVNLSLNARYQGRIAKAESFAREGYALACIIGNRRAIARAGSNLGEALYWNARYEESYELLRETLAIYLNLGDRQYLSTIYIRLGCAETFLGRYTEARATFTTALAEARAISFALEVGGALWGLILIDVAERAYAGARRRGEEAIAIYMRLGEHFFLSLIHGLCALAARGMGDRQQARQHAVAALHAALPARVWLATGQALCAIALLLADSGAPERSAELYALAKMKSYNGDDPWSQDSLMRELAAIVAALPPDIAAAAQERGRARDLWATACDLLTELETAGWGM
jgi:predicted ATPase/class 3 adenylate cyclase/tetratricopeptide (TPR) repeat protein